MERIFEEINRNSFRKLDKKILTNQMRDINSHKIIRSNKSDECPINNEDDCQSIEKNYFQNDSSYFNEQNNEIDNYLNNLRKKKEIYFHSTQKKVHLSFNLSQPFILRY